MKLLSFIVPVFNAENFIEQCLDSLLDQNIEKESYEIICINDGSTDRSLEILKKYQQRHKNIVVIDQPNGGVSTARSNGIKQSRAEYIWFVDADDFIEPNCLSDITKHLQEGADVINIYGCRITENFTLDEYRRLGNDKLVGDMQYWGYAGLHIYKADIIKNNDINFVKEIKYGEDELFYIDFFEKVEKDILLAPHPLYFYRQHAGSAMKKLRKYRNKVERVKSIILSMAILKNGVESGQYTKHLPKEVLMERRNLCLNCLASLTRKDARLFTSEMKENHLFDNVEDEKLFKKQLGQARIKRVRSYIHVVIKKIKAKISKRHKL